MSKKVATKQLSVLARTCDAIMTKTSKRPGELCGKRIADPDPAVTKCKAHNKELKELKKKSKPPLPPPCSKHGEGVFDALRKVLPRSPVILTDHDQHRMRWGDILLAKVPKFKIRTTDIELVAISKLVGDREVPLTTADILLCKENYIKTEPPLLLENDESDEEEGVEINVVEDPLDEEGGDDEDG